MPKNISVSLAEKAACFRALHQGLGLSLFTPPGTGLQDQSIACGPE